MYWTIFAQFLLFYYTDVIGLAVTSVSTILLITRLWDTVNDPLMGLVADRTRSRFGRYRPWLIWMILPMLISGVLVFTVPDISTNMQLWYVFLTYTAVGMVYTAINLPYAALMGVMTSVESERTSLATFRYIGSFLGNLVPQLTLLYLVSIIGQGNDQIGYVGSIIIYGLLAGVLFWFTFKLTKERVQPLESTEKISAKKDLKSLLGNKPWAIIAVAGALALVSLSIKNSVTIYYFKYYIDDQDLVSGFLALGTISAMIGICFTKKIINLSGGKRNGYLVVNLMSVIGCILFYLVGPENLILLYLLQAFYMFFMGPMMPLMFSLYADTADYGELKFGRRTTGLIFASGTSAIKMGMTVGAALSGWILGYVGYQANVVQSEETLYSIKLLMSWIPALFSLFGLIVLYFYPLNKKAEENMYQELELRRQNGVASVAQSIEREAD